MDIFAVASILFILIGLGLWKSYFFPSIPVVRERTATRLWLVLMPSCVFVVYLVLRKWSATDVRQDSAEIAFYLVFSAGWIVSTQIAFDFLGVSLRDDVAERGNMSAGFTVAGVTIGATCCIAGSNIGDGPGFEVVLFCAALSTMSLLVLWAAVAQLSGVVDAITIDRDLNAGIRTSGWLAGTGIVLGACVAGDWISYPATLKDFVKFGWPVAAVACGFAIFERAVGRRATPTGPLLTISILVAASMAFAGTTYALWVGRH